MSWPQAYRSFWSAVAKCTSLDLPPRDPGRNGGFVRHQFREGIYVYVAFNDVAPVDKSRRDLVVCFYDADRSRDRYLALEKKLRADPAMTGVRIDVAARDQNVWATKLTVGAGVSRENLISGPACARLAQAAVSKFEVWLRY